MKFLREYWVVLLIAMAGSGCAATRATPTVSFRAPKTGRQYTQKFGQAVFSRSDSGQVQVVLIDQGIEAPRTKTGGALPATAPPLKQIVTIRVLWRPMRAAKPNEATAENSAIEWYILGENAAGEQQDRLHYSGTGFVDVNVKGQFATVEIVGATLELVDRAGSLQDPIGRMELSASIQLRRDDALTSATLAQIRAQAASQQPAGSSHEGPPPRSPSGP